jgi:hypothetical protein
MKGLMEAGLSDWEAIQGGLAACRASGGAFLPPVGEFVASCRKAVYERLGALETMAAYKHLQGYYATPVERREPCYLNPFVYHLISQDSFDSFSFKAMKTDDAVEYFSSTYKVVLDYASKGGELRKPVQQDMRIDNPSGTTHQRKTSKESAHERIKALRAGLRGEQ